MTSIPLPFVVLGSLVLFGSVPAMDKKSTTRPAAKRHGGTIVVATKDSSPRSKADADFLGDGVGDQDEINAAIGALPPVGGTVLLAEGTYDIRSVAGTLGGVTIDRSHVLLAGRGTSTKLIQAADQNTNVIRIIGSGVGHVTIRDLYIDVNRDQTHKNTLESGVVRHHFEFNGIKAHGWDPRRKARKPTHDITVRNCEVRNAYCLNVMLLGPNMSVVDNVLGNATSDSVELLYGPGMIRGNYLEITGRTHVAIGSDAGNSIMMANNIVHVKKGGDLDIGFRSWANSQRHVVAGNVLVVDPGGKCTAAMEMRGFMATVTGNAVYTPDPKKRTRLRITGTSTVVTGNVLQNVIIEIHDQTGTDKPIIVRDNIMDNSTIEHKKGRLLAETRPG